MEITKYVWVIFLVVGVLGVVHGLFASRQVTRAAKPLARTEVSDAASEEDLGAVEELSRMSNGLSFLPKSVQVFNTALDNDFRDGTDALEIGRHMDLDTHGSDRHFTESDFGHRD
jgi:hypothetical protein